MANIDFENFYKKYQIFKCYKSNDKTYIDASTIDDIMIRLDSIHTNIHKEIQISLSIRYNNYLESMKKIIERELELLRNMHTALHNFSSGDEPVEIKYVEKVKNILTKDLIIIPVIESMCCTKPKIYYGQMYISNNEDYTGRVNDLFTLLKEDNDKIIDEDIYKEEDKTLMREIVLKFEHPDEYVNEEGDYNYNGMGFNGMRFENGDIKCELLSVARSFMFRYKTREHFKLLNRVAQYDYQEMKKSKSTLHSELKSLYKVFKRFMMLPTAIAIKHE